MSRRLLCQHRLRTAAGLVSEGIASCLVSRFVTCVLTMNRPTIPTISHGDLIKHSFFLYFHSEVILQRSSNQGKPRRMSQVPCLVLSMTRNPHCSVQQSATSRPPTPATGGVTAWGIPGIKTGLAVAMMDIAREVCTQQTCGTVPPGVFIVGLLGVGQLRHSTSVFGRAYSPKSPHCLQHPAVMGPRCAGYI
ncbi:hypothetical protein EDC04DRAFT_758390 [Pisolithus marmoratus]|nr:hypothetical protein EDC04DRAFT_758390 [Pisolithus marmoratus]